MDCIQDLESEILSFFSLFSFSIICSFNILGQYLIGTYRLKDGSIPWFNLYPKSKTSSTYYDYWMKNPETGRSVMGLHEGTRSAGRRLPSCKGYIERGLAQDLAGGRHMGGSAPAIYRP